MKLTIKEIAKKSGVSPATVSRIINGGEGVKPEKRESVKAILRQFAATPNSRKAASLYKNIGVLMFSMPEFDQRAVLSKLGTLSRSLPKRWSLVLLSPEILLQELEARHLRGDLSGLILFGYSAGSKEFQDLLTQIPHVWMNSHTNSENDKSILMGNELAGRLAARHLIDGGCRKCVALVASSLNPGFAARVDGFRFEFFSNSLNCDILELPLKLQPKEIEVCCDENLEIAMASIAEDESFTLYDGVFLPEERLTPFLYRAMQMKQLRKWPRIISCNHTPEYLAGLYPRPASIDLGAKMLAEFALKELMLRIVGEPQRDDNITVITTPKIIPGDPCVTLYGE